MDKRSIEQLVVDGSKRGIICYDEKEECIYANPAIREMFDAPQGGEELGTAFKRWYKESRDTYGDDFFIPYHNKARDKKFYFEVEEKLLEESSRSDDSNTCYIVTDVTGIYNAKRNEEYVRAHDILTNLYNRDYFVRRAQEILREDQEEYVILCLDIKEFKLVNDQCGYLRGNDVLVKIAGILREYESERCVCCRLENDKFAVCMPKKQFDESKAAIREQLDGLDQIVGKIRHVVAVYLGVYFVTDRRMTVTAMLDRAHVAINSIKGRRDRLTAYYTQDMMEEVVAEQRLISEMEEALAKGQFTIHLQPQTDASRHAVGAESLVRWNHPERGCLLPGKFINVFEKNGIIYKLDMFVWEASCKVLSKWKRMGREDMHLSVNISAKDFAYIDIYEELTALVEKYGIAPGQLHLELTETAVIEDLKGFDAIVMQLRNYGFLVEIDDFGTGYSSLSMLQEIHADVLKIDREFLKQVEKSQRSRIILETIIRLARQFDMQVIAEGVENAAQLELLTAEGVVCFQGYYFSKPLELEKFEEKYIV